MSIKYSVLSCKLATSFRVFQFLFFQVNHYDIRVIFQDIEHQLLENMVYYRLVFYEIHSKLFTGSFCDIARPYKLFPSQYLRYGDYLFLS